MVSHISKQKACFLNLTSPDTLPRYSETDYMAKRLRGQGKKTSATQLICILENKESLSNSKSSQWLVTSSCPLTGVHTHYPTNKWVAILPSPSLRWAWHSPAAKAFGIWQTDLGSGFSQNVTVKKYTTFGQTVSGWHEDMNRQATYVEWIVSLPLCSSWLLASTNSFPGPLGL